MPADPKRRLTVPLYNRVNPEPMHATAELRATLDGRRVSVIRELPPIPQGHMTFTDLNAAFAPEIAAGAIAADVVIVPDKRMHRPNFYVRPADRMWSWESVEHSDGRADSVVPDERRAFLRRADVHPWICPVPILPEPQEIDTFLHHLQEGAAKLHLFRLRGCDVAGRCAFDTDLPLGFGETVNATEWVKQQAPDTICRLVTLTAGDKAPRIPDSYQIIGGFKSRRGSSPPVSQLAGVSAANLPVDVEQTAHWRLPVQQSMLHVTPTEIFGKARVGPEFDTTVVLYNPSAFNHYERAALVE